MDSAERLPSRIRQLAFQSIDDLILWKKLSGVERTGGWRNGCAGVDLKLATAEDLKTQPNLCNRLSHSFCIIAIDQDSRLPVGYCWATNASRLEEGVAPFLYEINPKQGWLYVYDLHVDKRFRQFGLGSKILRGIVSEAKARKIKPRFIQSIGVAKPWLR